jgi:oligopeptide transport system permease protein
MLRLTVSRLIQLPILLWVIYTVTFALAWVAPGNPLEREGRKPPPEVQEVMKAKYSLDDPLKFYREYLFGKPQESSYIRSWLDGKVTGGVLNGDFGPSLFNKDWTVSQIIGGSLWVSIRLGLAAILLAIVLGVPVGVIGGVKRGGVADFLSTTMVLVGISLPLFVIGALLVLLFVLTIPLLPIGWGELRQMVLPTFTLSLPFAAYIARLTRLGMVDVLSSDFVRTARAKGLSETSVVFKHALKVAFLPVLSFLGPAAAAAMTGSFVVEKIFNIPGMGQHFVDAVLNKDLFLIMGVVLVYATLLILFNLAVDLTYRLVDPRIEV